MLTLHTRSSAFVSICPEIRNTTHKIPVVGNKYARNLGPPGGILVAIHPGDSVKWSLSKALHSMTKYINPSLEYYNMTSQSLINHCIAWIGLLCNRAREAIFHARVLFYK